MAQNSFKQNVETATEVIKEVKEAIAGKGVEIPEGTHATAYPGYIAQMSSKTDLQELEERVVLKGINESEVRVSAPAIELSTSTGGDISLETSQGNINLNPTTGKAHYKNAEVATVADLQNVVQFDPDNNIILRNGTKIVGTPPSGFSGHELLGTHEYDIDGQTLIQVEVASQGAHTNLNTMNDVVCGAGTHLTVDVYDTDGSNMGKETVAYLSDMPDVSTKVDNRSGVSGMITFATDAEAEAYSRANPNVLVISLEQ
ncbi:MAG: hypothetical protein LUE93_03600 [Bacteroides sp.]|nr:hypothetical protein [Bacteroides sp.]